MEDKFDLTPQEPVIPPQENAAGSPQPDEKPALPPEAMLTPPPRLQPSYIAQPERPPAPSMQPLFPPADQPEHPPANGVQPQTILTPPTVPPGQMLTPPAPTLPVQAPEDGFRQPAIAGQPETAPQYGGPTPPAQNKTYTSDYERIMALPPISKDEAYSCRHSHERRWYRRLIELNILLIVSVLILLIANFSDYRSDIQEFNEHIMSEAFSDLTGSDSDEDSESDAESDHEDSSDAEKEKSDRQKKKEKEREQSEYMTDFAEEMPSEIKLCLYGVIILITTLISLYLNFASVKASSLKITQNNFPEIYSLIHSYAYRLGMKKVPEAYVVQQNGVLNAFSSFIFGRQYILINTEIFEVAYREHKDFNALAFIIAHEMSHIYYGHATLRYNLPILFSMNLPIVGQIASRTREYSCDRLAQRLTNYDGVRAIIMLIVDRHLYPMVDVQDYVNTTINDHGFFLWLVNLLSTHPTMPKRLRALIQWNGSGELY